jgi:2-keto-4-pentenoate hydratase/2-oxohepta-3-ene-1,7-dioic acid hydratase in catechol pathway
VEHEAELACVMRRRVFRAGKEEALAAVWGYTCSNDVTARDIQRIGGNYLNVVWSKAYPAFCPIGPWIVVDEIDPDDVEVSCIVNGAVRQRERTSDFIFDMATQIAWISQIMPLEPGDLVLTGTPKGVGRLVPGDTVTIAIPGIGELSNPVVQGP